MGPFKRFSKPASPVDHHACTAAELLHVMANDKRIQMLTHLLNKEMTVGALAQAVDLCQSATSQHLAKLNALNLTERRREAQTIYYRVTSKQVRQIIEICSAGALTEPSAH
ncbi:ArsR/SmtB family transcription factor [Brucella pituitosa]|uniref:ArsR/SmtB family transcription factor n=1 Tax=Brucella pituitosa TaxID=571256 RepID=UPI0009A170D0|nr:metalloregulator ArsR/SmtB family transcription factor [Brucella pituitosa]